MSPRDSSAAIAQREDASLAAASLTDLTAPRRVTPGWALNLVITTGLLGIMSLVWLFGALVAWLALVDGGVLLPIVLVVGTGVLLGRGWAAIVGSVRARLRAPDLSDAAALPDTVLLLPAELQALVRDLRTLRVSLADEELDKPAILRELYTFVTALAETADESSRATLESRGLTPAALRSEVTALYGTADPRTAAIDLLDRCEQTLLATNADPFRSAR